MDKAEGRKVKRNERRGKVERRRGDEEKMEGKEEKRLRPLIRAATQTRPYTRQHQSHRGGQGHWCGLNSKDLNSVTNRRADGQTDK